MSAPKDPADWLDFMVSPEAQTLEAYELRNMLLLRRCTGPLEPRQYVRLIAGMRALASPAAFWDRVYENKA